MNWIYSLLYLTPAQGLLSDLMHRSLLFKGEHVEEFSFRVVQHFHLLDYTKGGHIIMSVLNISSNVTVFHDQGEFHVISPVAWRDTVSYLKLS